MKRRQALAWAVGSAAAGAGMGWGWWQAQSARISPSSQAPVKTEAALWELSFDAPSGTTLELGSMKGRPLLLNFWATWCPPCLKEMPMLNAFHRRHQAQGWQVLGLAIDGQTQVRDFMARQSLGFPIALAGPSGVNLSRSLGNEQGALPFTAVFDRHGHQQAHRLGAVNEADLAEWVRRIGN